ncbi:hypothetical protein DXG01_008146 [Tephrocybe rancida]|nr:hypothetical protein DXG01_008146 [Tephrocybe rancida]
MHLLLHLLFLFLGQAAAASSPLDVSLSSGVHRGVSTAQGIEKWLGIRYAQAPVGAMRFKAPVPVPVNRGATVDASHFGNACTQPPSSNIGAPVAEDCLFLNVFRPNGTTSSARMPVLIWIHGGMYTTGSGSEPSQDPTHMLQRSVTNGHPIIFVSINYRLNTFGFLASASVPPEDLNAGLQDQRVAFEFIQENIAAFGGDPEKATIWGQSAGGGSVEAHLIYPSPKKLFRSAMANSPTGPFKNSPSVSTYDEPGKPFARLLANVGCSAGRGAVACLRAVPFETLMTISNAMILATLNKQLWQPAIGPKGSLAPERASERIRRGDFLRVPYLAGTNINEGATFSQTLLPLQPSTSSLDDALFNQFIGNCVIDNSTLTPDVLSRFRTLFPQNDLTLNAPFHTGNDLFDRGEAWYTSQMFLGPRRLFFEHAPQGKDAQPVWGYYFGEFIPGNNVTLGVSHASELLLLFGPLTGAAEVETPFANQMLDFWLNFVNDMNPGDEWPTFDLNGRKILQLQRDNITAIPDGTFFCITALKKAAIPGYRLAEDCKWYVSLQTPTSCTLYRLSILYVFDIYTIAMTWGTDSTVVFPSDTGGVMDRLPPELIDSVIDYLQDDPNALVQCLTISRSWTHRCQLRLLQDLVLNLDDGAASTKIISLSHYLDSDPLRRRLVHSLEIRRLQWGVSARLGDAYAALLHILDILESTSSVQRVTLRCSGWDIRADKLERALLRLMRRESIKCIELDKFFVPSLPALTSLLSSPPNLTILRLKDIDCSQYQADFGPFIPEHKRPKLETLDVCAGRSGTTALEWLYHPHAPVNLAGLRHLRISDQCKPVFSQKLLQVAAPSIEHLDLGALHWHAQDPFAMNLAAMPYLRSLILRRGMSLSWIQQLFSDLTYIHPLEVVRIRKSASALRADIKWLECLDAYLTQPQLCSMRSVEFSMTSGHWRDADLDLFMAAFPMLREKGLFFMTMRPERHFGTSWLPISTKRGGMGCVTSTIDVVELVDAFLILDVDDSITRNS